MIDRVFLNALYDLAIEEAASGDAWFLPEAYAVFYIILNLAQCKDPYWRFAMWEVRGIPTSRHDDGQSVLG